MTARETCPACNNADHSTCFTVNGYNIQRCAGCATLFSSRTPSPEHLAAIYTSERYYELQPDSIRRIEEENLRRLKIIKRLKPTGKLLDIGCARGLLLDQAKQAGYTTLGIEPSTKNASHAAQNGHEVFNGWLADFVALNSEARFDIITCLDVIEHVSDPAEFLSLASSLLAQDGILVLSTPNYSGAVAKLLGQYDPYMTPPEHITFLTAAGVHHLASHCGLYIRQFKTFGKLIPAEIDRSIQRYFPKALHFLKPLLRPSIHASFWTLNLMKLGLEQEIYLAKSNMTMPDSPKSTPACR